MKIRDAHATISGDKTEYTMPSGGLDIIADDGRTLFGIHLNQGGSIRIDGGSFCKHGGLLMEDSVQIVPIASNVVKIQKPPYKQAKK